MATSYTNPVVSISGTAPGALGVWQYYINGLVMGDGTSYVIGEGREGFGTPELRVHDDARANTDGDWLGSSTYASRVLILPITIRGSSIADAMVKYNDLLTAWYNDPSVPYTSLWWKEFTELPRRAIGQPRRLAADKSTLKTNKVKVVAEFYSPFAPLFYETTSVTNSPFTSTGVGRSYPRAYAYSYAVTTNGGNDVNIVNLGAYKAHPVFTVAGPGQNPKVINDLTGEFLGVDVTLIAGDVLVLDTWLRTVTLNGANVRYKLTAGSTWWRCSRGNTPFRYTCSSPTVNVSNVVAAFASSDLG